MKKLLRQLLAGTLLVSTLAMGGFLIPVAQAQVQPLDDIYDRLRPVSRIYSQEGLLERDNAQAVLVARVASVINVALSLLGIIFLILVIYAGARWMSARGNEQLVEEARHTLINALIGLVIIIASYAFTYYLLTRILEATAN